MTDTKVSPDAIDGHDEDYGTFYDKRVTTSSRFYSAGYEIRHQSVQYGHGSSDGTPPAAFNMSSGFNPHGDYIGDSKTTYYLCVKRGIAPIVRTPTSKVCSIGYNAQERKWYGWSHRAIFGYGIGHVAKEGHLECNVGVTDEYLEDHPEADISIKPGTVAETLADAKRFAMAFAEAVG
jgi:hypothetical protein